MFTYDPIPFTLFLLLFHLAVFGLALLLMAGYALVRKLFPSLRRFLHDYLFTRRAAHRVAEIRAIGAQARSEMQQLYYEYTYWLTRQRNTPGDRS